MLIWKRYLLTKFWLSFIALLFLAFIFYTSVHHSLHAIKGNASFFISLSSLKLLLLYYLSQTVLKADFLFPQLIAIAATLTLFSMQSKREVLLLQASGLSLKSLITPLIASGGIVTLILYANFQWLYPICEKTSITKEHSDKEIPRKHEDKVPALYLKDQSVLLYSSIDQKSLTLNNIFWIKSPKMIYHVEKLIFSTPSLPIGFNVTEFSDIPTGELTLSGFFDMKEFPEIEFGSYENPFSKIFSAGGKNRLSEFYLAIPWSAFGIGLSKKVPQRILLLLSQFYYMLISPLACITAIVIPAYLCLRFSRTPKATLAYLIPLGVTNTFFVFLKAGVVLANSSVLPTFPVMMMPLCILSMVTYYSYSRLQ